MYKVTYRLIVIALLAVLALSACTGTTTAPDGDTDQIPETGATGTLAVDESPTAGLDTTPEGTDTAAVTETAEATVTSEATETVEATGTLEATATTGADTTPDADTTPTVTADAGGAGAVTGEGLVRLTSLLGSNVSAEGGEVLGQVEGVLMEHPVPPAEEEETGEAVEATPTLAATPTVDAEVTPAVDQSSFTVRYVLLDTADADQAGSTEDGTIVILPWQAFDFTAAGADGGYTLGSETSDITGAPRMTLADAAANLTERVGEADEFWTGQGITGTMTPEQAENLSLILFGYRGITITGMEGEDFGTISDFLIDPASGAVRYAVFSGGEEAANQFYVVPVSLLNWEAGTGTQLGAFTLNFGADALTDAPSFSSLEEIETGQDATDQIDEFWQEVTPAPAE